MRQSRLVEFSSNISNTAVRLFHGNPRPLPSFLPRRDYCRSLAYLQADPTNGAERYEVVCARCEPVYLNSANFNVDIADTATIPDCKELPAGVHETPNDTTVATLMLKTGFYRPSIISETIRECYQAEACLGGTDPDRYCAAHYKGPCECISGQYRSHRGPRTGVR